MKPKRKKWRRIGPACTIFACALLSLFCFGRQAGAQDAVPLRFAKENGCICIRIGANLSWMNKAHFCMPNLKASQPGPGMDVCQEAVRVCSAKKGAGQLACVNSFWNRIPWRSDRKVWGMRDYWAHPAEFALRGGDCEDFAIAKMDTLRRLGWPKESLWLAGWRRQKKGGEAHVALAAEHAGQFWMLDTNRPLLKEQALLQRGEPVFFGTGPCGWMFIKVKDQNSASVRRTAARQKTACAPLIPLGAFAPASAPASLSWDRRNVSGPSAGGAKEKH